MTEVKQETPIDIRILAEALVNPKAALMHLTLETDRELRKLLVSAGMLKKYLDSSSPGLPYGLLLLKQAGSQIPPGLDVAINEFWLLRNSALHNPNFEVPPFAFDRGLKILHILQNVPRPTYIVKQANVSLYADRTCRIRREDIVGVMLETFDAQGNSHGIRVFPTLMQYVDGLSVGWEWSNDFKNHVWGDTWFKDPATGQCTLGWNSSTAFMGRDVNEV